MSVDDGSHQAVSAVVTRPVYGSVEYLTFEEGEFYFALGQEVILQAKVMRFDRNPVADREVHYVVKWLNPDNWNEEIVSRSSATSSSDGVAPSAYRPEKPGWYTVYASARDEGKFIMELEQWLYVEGGISASQDYTLLSIRADQKSYGVGDTARLPDRIRLQRAGSVDDGTGVRPEIRPHSPDGAPDNDRSADTDRRCSQHLCLGQRLVSARHGGRMDGASLVV